MRRKRLGRENTCRFFVLWKRKLVAQCSLSQSPNSTMNYLHLPLRFLTQRTETAAHRYEGDNGKCQRWQWICHSWEMPFFVVPQQRCSLQVSVPCQAVEPAHPYACYYTWNSMRLLVVRCGYLGGQADRMSFASRPVRQWDNTGSADQWKGATKILRADWCTAVTAGELLYLVDKVECQHIRRAIFNMTSFGNSTIYCLMTSNNDVKKYQTLFAWHRGNKYIW